MIFCLFWSKCEHIYIILFGEQSGVNTTVHNLGLRRVFSMKCLVHTIYAFLLFEKFLPVNTLRSGCTATIIGSTGVIGANVLTKLITEDRCDCFASYLGNEEEIVTNFVRLSKDRRHSLNVFELDFRNRPILESIPTSPGSEYEHQHALVNAAGVCIPGNTLECMKESLCINSIGPLVLAQSFVSKLMQGKTKNAVVINISSGEGEHCQLNSAISRKLLQIQSIAKIFEYAAELEQNFNPAFEYAYGATPMYSLSKAVLNKGTLLLQKEFVKSHPGRVRILACCPGNVASPMSTLEELLTATPADVAAEHIIQLMDRPDLNPGGQFYRNGKIIPW